MESRRLKTLASRIDSLSSDEHGVILKIVQDELVPCDRNTNGYFFDMSRLDERVVKRIEEFVDYSLQSNENLEVHDKCMHDTLQLLKRMPPGVCETKPRKVHTKDASKTDAPFTNKGTKLAFYKRAGDVAVKRRGKDDVIEQYEEPLLLGGTN